MKIKELSVRFTDNAEEEVVSLAKDLQLMKVAGMLRSPDIAIPDEYRAALYSLLSVVTDLFATSVPLVSNDPEETLRAVSRDINLARLLRERGLFRLYLLINRRTKPEDGSQGVPIFMSMINPLDGSPFAKQEDFIAWFCDEAHVARSLVFMRLATIGRLVSLGFTLDDAFSLIITKPYAIREILNMVANWRQDDLVSVNPETMLRLADHIVPEAREEIAEIITAMQEDPDDASLEHELREASRPVIAGLLREVGDHERTKDAMDWVKFDLLKKPEIKYSFDPDGCVLNIEYHQRASGQDGEEYSLPPIVIPFVPDTTTQVPPEVIKDLITRLPIRNRNLISLDL